jgi:hypothetical protein
MVVVLLGCVGLTAGVAFGTVFSGNEARPSIVLPVQGSCHQDWYYYYSPSDLRADPRPYHPAVRCLFQLPVRISDSAGSGRLPMSDYVLSGLLAGLSAALGFLVPPRSRATGVH